MNITTLATIGLGSLLTLSLINTSLAQDDDRVRLRERGAAMQGAKPFASGQHRGKRAGAGRIISRLDTDGDAMISEEEFLSAHITSLEHLMERLDSNADGLLSMDEIEARESRGGRRGTRPVDNDQVQACLAAEIDDFSAPAGRALGQRFDAIDRNGDGLLSLEELTAATQDAASARFALADTDADGYLTREELRARAARHRQQALAVRKCLRSSLQP